MMKKQFLKILLMGIIASCFLMAGMQNANAYFGGGLYGNSGLFGGGLYGGTNLYSNPNGVSRNANWYDINTGTSAGGGTWISSNFGPDVGYGEYGTRYEYTDPMTGRYTSYSTTGMGQAQGMAGMLPIYGGMYSGFGGASYGPYAGGQNPSVQQTPFYDTQGYMSGNLWGQNTQAYQSQFNFMGGMMGMLTGSFGGYGGNSSAGYGGGGYGYPGGYGGYGGYGGGYSGYGGYPQGMYTGNSGGYNYNNYFY